MWRIGCCLGLLTAFGNDAGFSVFREIGQQFLGVLVEHHGADRDGNAHVGAPASMAVAASSGLAFFGLVMFLVTKIQQGAEASGGFNHDAAAVTAVTAVRAAARTNFSRRKLQAPLPP